MFMEPPVMDETRLDMFIDGATLSYDDDQRRPVVAAVGSARPWDPLWNPYRVRAVHRDRGARGVLRPARGTGRGTQSAFVLIAPFAVSAAVSGRCWSGRDAWGSGVLVMDRSFDSHSGSTRTPRSARGSGVLALRFQSPWNPSAFTARRCPWGAGTTSSSTSLWRPELP